MQSIRECSIAECSRAVMARGWCQAHYNRWHQTGDVRASVPLRPDGVSEYDRVMRAGFDLTESGCWETRLAKTPLGYGRLYSAGGRANRRHLLAHRVVAARMIRPAGSDELVCHSCDNPPCINPDHLFIGSNDDNLDDMRSKDRDTHGEASLLAKLTDVQVAAIRSIYREGRTTQRELALQFDVSQSQISRIVNRKSRRRPT